jgi:hypothetical protein
MGNAGDLLTNEDEAAVRELITFGMDSYLTHMIERAPVFMFGPSRDVGGANVAEAMDELHDLAFDKLFSGTPRWAKSTLARETYRIQCYALELFGSRYRAGALTRDECLTAMVETLMAYRFRILPSIG